MRCDTHRPIERNSCQQRHRRRTRNRMRTNIDYDQFQYTNNFEGHVYVKDCTIKLDVETMKADDRWPVLNCHSIRVMLHEHDRSIHVVSSSVPPLSSRFIHNSSPKSIVPIVFNVSIWKPTRRSAPEIEVSEITTAFQTQIVPMPVCRYEVRCVTQIE